jgi:7,8-dihydropterin-6-yl-methyl-4-(beta-D-ribofuranosyl)aminobenzene 5'-phosphate synthase
MRIITLIENVVNSPKLVAEHGLSLYIETANKKILFDTGQSGLFLQNAITLGISIEDIDCLVLSHGHYDHTGGLYPFLEKNSKANVYAKQNLFIPKYSGKTRFIGTLYNDELLKNRLVYVDSATEMAENIFIMPDTPIHLPVDTNFKGLYRKADQKFETDEFDDELFMAIKQDDKINILTACSHRGITNICTTATNHFKLPIGLILGGFHMKECSIEQYVHITHYFRMLQPESIGSCHCTGIDKFAEMHSECETHMFYNYTGNEITI